MTPEQATRLRVGQRVYFDGGWPNPWFNDGKGGEVFVVANGNGTNFVSIGLGYEEKLVPCESLAPAVSHHDAQIFAKIVFCCFNGKSSAGALANLSIGEGEAHRLIKLAADVYNADTFAERKE